MRKETQCLVNLVETQTHFTILELEQFVKESDQKRFLSKAN